MVGQNISYKYKDVYLDLKHIIHRKRVLDVVGQRAYSL
jgi:hypothetical protein